MQKRTNEPSRRLEEEALNPQPAEPVNVPSDAQPLIDMVEILCAGLEWNIENHPEVMNESDAEALQEARALLSRYGNAAQPADDDDPDTSPLSGKGPFKTVDALMDAINEPATPEEDAEAEWLMKRQEAR